MAKNINSSDNFFFQIIKNYLPTLLYQVVAAIIAFVILRTDVAALTRRVDALDTRIIGRDVATEKFNALTQRVDELTKKIDYLVNLHINRQN